MNKQYFVYIMTNNSNTVTYTGVTNDLHRRENEHKNKANSGFTSRYTINKLVFFEVGDSAESVILKEKQIKSWKRKEKINLINAMNPDWHDFYMDLVEDQDRDCHGPTKRASQ